MAQAPATNLPSLLLLLRAAPRHVVARLAAVTSGVALLLSYVVDAADVELNVDHEGASTALALPGWFVQASPWIAAPLAAAALAQAVAQRVWPASADPCCAPERGAAAAAGLRRSARLKQA